MGTLDALLGGMLFAPGSEVMYTSTWAISNICACNAVSFERKRPAVLAQVLLYSPYAEVIANVCWAISDLLNGPDEHIGWMLGRMGAHTIDRIVDLLGSEHGAVRWAALRVVGNVLTGSEEQAQTVLDSGALPLLRNLVGSRTHQIAREACWAISNVTAGTVTQIEEVIESGVVRDLVRVLSATNDGGEWRKVQREAIWAISNACDGGTAGQVAAFVRDGCVAQLCAFVSRSSSDSDAQVALAGLNHILQKDGRRAMKSFDLIRETVGPMEERDSEFTRWLAREITQACAYVVGR